MINLLEGILVADRDLTGVLGPRAGQLLEWPRVTGQIARLCINTRAAEAVRARRPFSSLEPIELQRALADEMRPAGEVDHWPPLVELSGALDLLEQEHPIRLEGPDLVHIAAVAEELDRLRDHFLQDRQRCPLWGEAAIQLTSFSGVSGAIRRALDLDGSILDSASPLLSRLRRSLVGQEQSVRREVGRAMADARNRGWTTAAEPTLRGERFCLPMRSGDSRKVSGIVHDRSATGATLFVEPAAVVHLANALAETRLEIAAEEARILFELNRAVEQAADALRESAELMLLVDQVRAQLLWSRQVGGNRPQLVEQGTLRICAGRHPLLMEALGQGSITAGRSQVVPLDLELPQDARALVISGPNAGGKSVALKSVGVFCLLAQCGWDVPAREDTVLPLVRRLLVDLGDDQSIAESLSSFSAHLRHLARFLEDAEPGCLVLCDEIGSGTDPQEGTALAYAVLARLAERGATVLASTHFGLLKAAVHEHPGMVNAAMDYDERDLQPLFTFRVGDPGTSHAFDIAARMGIPVDLLEQARAMAGQERVQVEQLLADLDRRARELADEQEKVRQAALRGEEQSSELARRLKGLGRERREVLAEARRQSEDLVREGRRAIEQVVREIRSRSAEKPVVQAARDRIAKLGEQLDNLVGDDSREETTDGIAPTEVSVGQRIRIPHLGLIGSVVEVRGGKVTALADGLRLNVGLDAVRLMDPDGRDLGPAASNEQQGKSMPANGSVENRRVAEGSWNWEGTPSSTSPEIDLRGETGDEAWERLDRLIDRAIPAGLEVLNVIHGYGTGRLREALHAHLKADPRVASFREAGAGAGGGGATHVFLTGD